MANLSAVCFSVHLNVDAGRVIVIIVTVEVALVRGILWVEQDRVT